MEQSLFRSEVAEAKRMHALGPARIALSNLAWPFSGMAVVAVLATVIFLCAGTYTRRERVGGQLLPSEGLLVVSAVNAGIVQRAFVGEGEAVAEGQPLLEISTNLSSPTIGEIGAIIDAGLRSQLEHLRADLADEEISNRQRIASANGRVTLVREQLALAAAQREIRNQQLASASKLTEQLRPMAEKGLVGRFEFKQHETEALEAESQLRSVDLLRLDLEGQLNAAEQLVQQQPRDGAARQRGVEARIADVEQALARNDAQRSLMILAPRTGKISQLTAKPGQGVAPGQHLMALVPENSLLRAELWVPSRTIGFIAPGDKVLLRYHAYPYEKFGAQAGTVREVTESALSAPEATQLLGRYTNTPLYRVTVELESQILRVQNTQFPLRSNMTFEADVLLERRRLIEWLFAPAAAPEVGREDARLALANNARGID